MRVAATTATPEATQNRIRLVSKITSLCHEGRACWALLRTAESGSSGAGVFAANPTYRGQPSGGTLGPLRRFP